MPTLTDGLPCGADITALLTAALARSMETHDDVTLGPGNWSWSAPLRQDGCTVILASANTHLSYTGPSVLGTAAWTVTNETNGDILPEIVGGAIYGTGRGQLGVRLPRPDGVRLGCPARVRGTVVRGFDASFVDASPQGHIHLLDGAKGTDSYAGLRLDASNGDVNIVDADLSGSTMAGIVISPGQGMHHSVIRDTPLGFSPFGIVKLSAGAVLTSPSVFLDNVEMDRANFESIGNEAIADFSVGDGGANRSAYSDVISIEPGYSLNAAYSAPQYPSEYVLRGDLFYRRNEFTSGDGGFVATPPRRVFGFAQVVVNDPNGTTTLDGANLTDNASMTAPIQPA